MPVHYPTYRCLIISPGDVAGARDIIENEIHAWNAQAGQGLRVRVEAVRWESHTRPDLSDRGQAIVNKQLDLQDIDFGVALFWSRIGSPTGKYISGSVEEMEQLFANEKRIMAYFSDASVPQRVLTNDDDRQQFDEVHKLRKALRPKGLTDSYENDGDLRVKFSRHLSGLIPELMNASAIHHATIVSAQPTLLPTPLVAPPTSAVQMLNVQVLSCDIIESKITRTTYVRDLETSGNIQLAPEQNTLWPNGVVSTVYQMTMQLFVKPEPSEVVIVRRDCMACFLVPSVIDAAKLLHRTDGGFIEGSNPLTIGFIEPITGSQKITRDSDVVVIYGPGRIAVGAYWKGHSHQYGQLDAKVALHLSPHQGKPIVVECFLDRGVVTEQERSNDAISCWRMRSHAPPKAPGKRSPLAGLILGMRPDDSKKK